MGLFCILGLTHNPRPHLDMLAMAQRNYQTGLLHR